MGVKKKAIGRFGFCVTKVGMDVVPYCSRVDRWRSKGIQQALVNTMNFNLYSILVC